MKKTDLIVIVLLIAVAGLIYGCLNFFNTDTDTVAEIYYRGEYCCSLSLDKDMVYTHPALPDVKIQIKDGMIGFIESDCPDKVCINTGFLSRAGQTAVCLPNAISVVIKSKTDDLDTVV